MSHALLNDGLPLNRELLLLLVEQLEWACAAFRLIIDLTGILFSSQVGVLAIRLSCCAPPRGKLLKFILKAFAEELLDVALIMMRLDCIDWHLVGIQDVSRSYA